MLQLICLLALAYLLFQYFALRHALGAGHGLYRKVSGRAYTAAWISGVAYFVLVVASAAAAFGAFELPLEAFAGRIVGYALGTLPQAWVVYRALVLFKNVAATLATQSTV